MELLLPLVRSALYGVPLEDDVLQRLRHMGEDEWDSIIDLARKQTVTGLLYKALEQNSGALEISEDVAFRLVGSVSSILGRNSEMAEAEKAVLSMFEAHGLHPAVMKGSTCAARYPSPELRESGDIDLFFAGDEFSGAISVLDEAGMQHQSSPDSSVVFIHGNCVVELHDRYFDLHVPASVLPPVPSAEAELLMLSAHILKHACSTGVGLRQICDFALAWDAYPGDRDAIPGLFRRVGLLRWHRLLTSFIDDYLKVSPPRKSSGEGKLLQIIAEGGNFGHHTVSRGKSLDRSAGLRKLDTARLILSRIPFSLRYAPRETFFFIRDLILGNIRRPGLHG